MKTYDKLLRHIEHHNVRRWLIDGACDENARTIRDAIDRMNEGQLNRGFARMLAAHYHDYEAP